MKLVELEDNAWFPVILRDQQLGYIGWLVKWLDLYSNVNDLLKEAIENANVSVIQDLASGSGEPLHSIMSEINLDIPHLYSDKFPPQEDVPLSGKYISHPVDIMNLNPMPDTFYTMFNAFHHFDSEEQKLIIGRFKDANACFFFVEVLEPSIIVLIKTIFANTIGQIILAPFVQPFSFLRLVLTYLIPLNLITTTYDGIISVLKSKNKKEYESLLSTYDDLSYCIQIQTCPAPLRNSLVIIQGFPRHQ